MKLQNVVLCALSPLLLLIAPGAQANLIKVEFKTNVQTLIEWQVSTNTANFVGESTITGKHVAIGDSISGYFIYDTNTPGGPNPFPVPGLPLPGSDEQFIGGLESSLVFDTSGLTYQSNLPGGIYVRESLNAPGGPDDFLMRTYSVIGDSYFGMALDMWDPSGVAIAGPGLPTTLPWSPSSTYSLEYFWDQGDRRVSAHGSVFDLHVVDLQAVPEPGTVFLFAASLALCLTSRRAFKR